jgi:hypothetical protein
MPTKWLVRSNLSSTVAAAVALIPAAAPSLDATPPPAFGSHRAPQRNARYQRPADTKRYVQISAARRRMIQASRRRNRSR